MPYCPPARRSFPPVIPAVTPGLTKTWASRGRSARGTLPRRTICCRRRPCAGLALPAVALQHCARLVVPALILGVRKL